MTLLIILLVGLLFSSAFFSASETALFSLSSSKQSIYVGSEHKGKRAAGKLLQTPKSLLITLLIMNIAVNLAVQNITSSIFGSSLSFWWTVALPFVLTLIFGEILPKTMAITKNERIATFVSPLLLFLSKILTPIRKVILWIARIVSFLFSFLLKKDTEVTKEELRHAVISSKAEGLLSKDETTLLLGSLRLSQMHVKEVQCPRQNIYYHDIHDSVVKLKKLFMEKRLSKIPVIDKEIDNVIGTIHAKSFFTTHYAISEPKDLQEILEKPYFVPESMLTRTLLAHFDEKHLEIAYLVDEYGGVSGLITREDLVEIVVGQIKDAREEKALYSRQEEDVIICSGKYELNDLEALFDVQIERKAGETTVGGYLLEILGDIPKSGYKVEENGLLFHVLLATESKVSRVYVKNVQKKKVISE